MIVIMNLFDAFSTMLWLEIGWATEANPFMLWTINMGVREFILVKTFLVLLSVLLLWRLRSVFLARVLVMPVACLYIYVSIVHIVAFFRLAHVVGSGEML